MPRRVARAGLRALALGLLLLAPAPLVAPRYGRVSRRRTSARPWRSARPRAIPRT